MQSHKCLRPPPLSPNTGRLFSTLSEPVKAGSSRPPEVRIRRVYLYFPLVANGTRVPVVLCDALPSRRTAANLAGFGVDCLLSPGCCSPGRTPNMTCRLYILWSNKLIIGIPGRDYGGITITAGPIRSPNRTPTKHLGSPLLDHFISRHMRRGRTKPSTTPHTR